MSELSRSQLLVYGLVGVAILVVGARWIRENGKRARTWGNICSWRQHLPTCSLNLLESVRNIVNHDVYACLLVRSSVALLHPCSANTTCVVER